MDVKKEYMAKAALGKKSRYKAMAIVAIVALVTAVGIFLMIYNLFEGKTLFCIGYLAASILGIGYIIIEINSIFATFLAIDRKKIYMKNWRNGFVPFNLKHKVGFIREFIPAGTRILEIKFSDVDRCLLGSSNFLRRYCHTDYDFIEKLNKFEGLGFISKVHIKRMDYFYIETRSGESCFMPVTGFDEAELTKIVIYIEKITKIKVRCNNPEVVKRRETLKR